VGDEGDCVVLVVAMRKPGQGFLYCGAQRLPSALFLLCCWLVCWCQGLTTVSERAFSGGWSPLSSAGQENNLEYDRSGCVQCAWYSMWQLDGTACISVQQHAPKWGRGYAVKFMLVLSERK
jgi:hypothetical protein